MVHRKRPPWVRAFLLFSFLCILPTLSAHADRDDNELCPLIVIPQDAPQPLREAAQRFSEKYKGQLLSVKPGEWNYARRPLVKPALALRSHIAEKLISKKTNLLVFLGDAHKLPMFQVFVGRHRVQTDFFYGDLHGDGFPEIPTIRLLGKTETMIRGLQGGQPVGRNALILCSEPTPIHLETKRFLELLNHQGYTVSFARGKPQDMKTERALTGEADLIVHFGHGTPLGLQNRFGQPFLHARTMPKLNRRPIALIDGCATAPIDSPLVNAFFDAGGRFYFGSSAVVLGMEPGEYTNRLMDHFFALQSEDPDELLVDLLHKARLRYINTVPGLKEKVKLLATGSTPPHPDLLTVTQWVLLGDPTSRLASNPPVTLPFKKTAISPLLLAEEGKSIPLLFPKPQEGTCVLSLFTRQAQESVGGTLVVEQDGKELHRIKTGDKIIYQRLKEVCYGGYSDGAHFHGRFLLPLQQKEGESILQLRWEGAKSGLQITENSTIEYWGASSEE